jgi:hypothetical protein
MTRILGQKLKKTSWRPRRTLVFISWGAEEHGLVDSREFVEDFMPKVRTLKIYMYQLYFSYPQLTDF